MPAVGVVAPHHVLGKGQIGFGVDGDVVVVVHHDELAETPDPGERRGFARDPLHQTTVPGNHVGVVVDNLVTGAVIHRR